MFGFGYLYELQHGYNHLFWVQGFERTFVNVVRGGSKNLYERAFVNRV